MARETPATAASTMPVTSPFWNAQVRDNFIYLFHMLDTGFPRQWPGSDTTALLGSAAPSGGSRTARAPGTALLVLSATTTLSLSATLCVESGGTATVSLYEVADPDTPVSGSTLTSTHADGEVKTTAALTLAAGTYFLKGHSGHASYQAWGVDYVFRTAA